MDEKVVYRKHIQSGLPFSWGQPYHNRIAREAQRLNMASNLI
jgi:hypothetical protein